MNLRNWIHLIILSICFAVHLFFFINLFIHLPWPILLVCIVMTGAALCCYKFLKICNTTLHRLLTITQMLLPVAYICNHGWLQVILLIIISIIIEMMRSLNCKGMAVHSREIKHLEKALESANLTFLDLRLERHDYMKHITSLQFLLEKGAYKDSIAYMKRLIGSYEDTHEAIKGEESAVGAILYQSKKLAKLKKVQVTYNLDAALSSLPLSLKEKTAFLENILGNAIDAAASFQKEKGEKASVTVECVQKQGFFVLICKNDTLPIPNSVLDHLFQKQGLTTKNGTHEGLGTTIIRRIVDQHIGYLEFKYKKETFTLKIKLPAIVGSEEG
ncbi:LytT family two-component system sensor histidine kinase NatK [Scopulibacillus darangshiensis]|uniref:LytT family two-component system sensor histidine kinase NatK n=1 Tax=Scopulibacillus darangshiensis TaxID=442528 RepID=A0A4R2P511_9BACL|nr:GHKL domain-containing protein [Scopulibacillus darangshiensis]TCP29041.1 LytT family two-component system sensor histidine kinase NatK [Scopulibacillus darangshiensis]